MEDLKKRVASLVYEVNTTHRYSMSRIYNLYNEVFSKSETPQSCASCLIRKVNELDKWLKDAEKNELKTAEKKRKEAKDGKEGRPMGEIAD